MVLLLVEDTPDEILLFRRALNTLATGVTLVEMRTATAASLYLKKEPPHEGALPPDLIVSDSVVDHESGEDLLEWIRAHPQFQNIPFILFTGNTNPAIAKRALALGATKVVQKPAVFTELVEIVRDILNVVQRP